MHVDLVDPDPSAIERFVALGASSWARTRSATDSTAGPCCRTLRETSSALPRRSFPADRRCYDQTQLPANSFKTFLSVVSDDVVTVTIS